VRALLFDPFAGISGDMILGALVDLGLDPAWLQDFVASLGLPGARVVVGRTGRRAIDCGRVNFELPREHAHRHLPQVLEIVEQSGASMVVKERAGEAFRRLARAEAAIHGVTVEQVHFHEVGALDSILDVLCAMAAVEELGFQEFTTRPVAVGTGWVQIAHGRFPVPAPATLKLLEGLPVRETGFEGECTTPTGAAVLATLTEGRRAPARYVLRRSGYGAGTRDPADRPNCLRLVEYSPAEDAAGELFLLQSDVDDLAPEYAGVALQALLDAGALDATVSALAMKKGRPGQRLEALLPEAALTPVLAALFRATPTIGVRYWPVQRAALERSEELLEWRGQTIRHKRVRLPDGSERVKPEFDDVVRAAGALGLEPLQVRAALEQERAARAGSGAVSSAPDERSMNPQDGGTG
jgi:pyridinium-3,5-bisthiocarboxylic acid mononucleotide nickel chelatase